jgi:hypothetical protein
MESDNQNRPERPTGDCPEITSRQRIAERFLRPGEDPHEFNKLYDEICAKWQPGSVTEWFHFERILANRWVLVRLNELETAVFTQIGRAVWERGGDADFKDALRADWRRITGVMRNLAKARAIKVRGVESAIRSLEREQARRQRIGKRAPAERVRRPRIADLEPVTRSIQ